MIHSGPATVLLCDDVDELRVLVRDVLDDGRVLTVAGEAADGGSAVRQAAELQPDIVVLDLTMPGLEPTTLVAEIGRVAPRAVIVAYSGHTPADVVGDAASAIALHLPKTTALDVMRQRLVAISVEIRHESA